MILMLQIELYADSETFKLLGKFLYIFFFFFDSLLLQDLMNLHLRETLGGENAFLICNHRSDIDWLIGWVLAEVNYFKF